MAQRGSLRIPHPTQSTHMEAVTLTPLRSAYALVIWLSSYALSAVHPSECTRRSIGKVSREDRFSIHSTYAELDLFSPAFLPNPSGE